jgi:hypothetical protein
MTALTQRYKRWSRNPSGKPDESGWRDINPSLASLPHLR